MDKRYLEAVPHSRASPLWGEVSSYLASLYESIAECLPELDYPDECDLQVVSEDFEEIVCVGIHISNK